MYIGSKDSKGLLHCVKEIISNSIDEFLNGAGNTIIIKVQADGGIYIKDNGRGIPHGKHESGCSILQACYGVANTGGKFNNATGETGYNTSGGEHGTGGKAVNALSKKMIVSTSRDGIKEIVEFSRGDFINYTKENSTEQGVEVLFYPDEEVFETIVVDSKELEKMIQEFSFLSSGLSFHFIDENKNIDKTYYSEKGLYDYINYLNNDKDFLVEPWYFTEKEDTYQLEVVIGYNFGYNNICKLYTNNIPQEKGTHLTGFRTALTQSFNNFARENKLLKEKEENLAGSDFLEGQLVILNFKMIDPVFKGQNKEELSSSEGRTYVQKLTGIGLEKIFSTNSKDVKVIIDKALNARKAREAAKKARDAARNTEQKKKKALKFASKLADCNNTNRRECEIYITEGDSATGGLKMGRNEKFQAVMPVRGKILNCQKASLEQIQKNAEIMTMIEAFGLTIDTKTMKVSYKPDELRYGKIIIMSDADVDGSHIKNLFYTFIWNFCPQLIKDGYIYAGVPPLYKITEKNGKSYKYLKDDSALEEYRKAHKGEKYVLGRMKGLGEMSEEEVSETLMDPDKRIIRQISVADEMEANKIFEKMMGDSVIPRKDFLKQYSEESIYNGE